MSQCRLIVLLEVSVGKEWRIKIIRKTYIPVKSIVKDSQHEQCQDAVGIQLQGKKTF